MLKIINYDNKDYYVIDKELRANLTTEEKLRLKEIQIKLPFSAKNFIVTEDYEELIGETEETEEVIKDSIIDRIIKGEIIEPLRLPSGEEETTSDKIIETNLGTIEEYQETTTKLYKKFKNSNIEDDILKAELILKTMQDGNVKNFKSSMKNYGYYGTVFNLAGNVIPVFLTKDFDLSFRLSIAWKKRAEKLGYTGKKVVIQTVDSTLLALSVDLENAMQEAK